jgi:hypothetical protein
LIFGTKLLELCPHRRKPTLEDADDLGANLGCRKTGPVYKSTPAINFILRADDHLIGMRYTAMRRSVSLICCIRSSTVMALVSPLTASAIAPCVV